MKKLDGGGGNIQGAKIAILIEGQLQGGQLVRGGGHNVLNRNLFDTCFHFLASLQPQPYSIATAIDFCDCFSVTRIINFTKLK